MYYNMRCKREEKQQPPQSFKEAIWERMRLERASSVITTNPFEMVPLLFERFCQETACEIDQPMLAIAVSQHIAGGEIHLHSIEVNRPIEHFHFGTGDFESLASRKWLASVG